MERVRLFCFIAESIMKEVIEILKAASSSNKDVVTAEPFARGYVFHSGINRMQVSSAEVDPRLHKMVTNSEHYPRLAYIIAIGQYPVAWVEYTGRAHNEKRCYVSRGEYLYTPAAQKAVRLLKKDGHFQEYGGS
jgi:hypothetical protein